jgi:hypothetical protein
VESEPFDDGLFVGRMNSRGITTRGVYDGGSSERQLAAGYREDAAALEARWPRTAEILRRLQRSYERMADEEDDEAGRRADEGLTRDALNPGRATEIGRRRGPFLRRTQRTRTELA